MGHGYGSHKISVQVDTLIRAWGGRSGRNNVSSGSKENNGDQGRGSASKAGLADWGNVNQTSEVTRPLEKLTDIEFQVSSPNTSRELLLEPPAKDTSSGVMMSMTNTSKATSGNREVETSSNLRVACVTSGSAGNSVLDRGRKTWKKLARGTSQKSFEKDDRETSRKRSAEGPEEESDDVKEKRCRMEVQEESESNLPEVVTAKPQHHLQQ